MMVRKITIEPYDPHWKTLFIEEAARLREIFGKELLAVHHIGSTSVPELMAKPIIDVLPVVRDIEKIDAFNSVMREKGYLPRGEYGLAERRYFIRGAEEQRTHHIHTYQQGHPDILRHLAFRDYLIAHPQRARDYETLKLELVRRFDGDNDAYIEGKDGLVQEIQAEALAWISNEDR